LSDPSAGRVPVQSRSGHFARILHVAASDQLRGAELFAADLVRALNSFSVEQRVAVLRRSAGTSVQYDAPVSVIGPKGGTMPGFRVQPRAVASLRRLIERWRPAIIQAHGGEALKYSVVATVGHSTPVIYRRIGAAPRWITRGPRRLAYGMLLRRTARVVAVADSVRRETVELFGIRHVITIPNAVDGTRITSSRGREVTRRALGISASAPVVLSVGALTWEKDPLTHVELGRRVIEQLPEAVHLIAGDGPMQQEVARTIEERGLRDRVLLLGRRADVPDLLAASDVLLFASRPDGMEGMPAIVIEAGMMGVPVVGFAVVGVPEVVLDGHTGLLARHGDINSLAGHATRLLREQDARQALGAAAQERCRARFDIGVVAPRYVETYEDVARESVGLLNMRGPKT
jgi:glycosyltransferase involved in cell wall biosynthesis